MAVRKGVFGQARGSGRNKIKMTANLDPLIAQLGVAQALAHSMDDKVYTDALMDTALDTAEDKFNNQTAALAMATGEHGNLSHMYEWGTIGIHHAKSNMRMQPSNPAARLWNTFTVGSGFNRSMGFIYRPSVADVPKPTARDTGMSTDVIQAMRDYQFTWKAKLFEESGQVVIAPKRKFLLIPAYEQNRPYMENYDIKRGYSLLTKPIYTTVGNRNHRGKFTEWWLKFWFGEGNEIVNADLQKMIEEDYMPELIKPRGAGTMRPVGTYQVKAQVAQHANSVRKRKNAKARLRYRQQKAMRNKL